MHCQHHRPLLSMKEVLYSKRMYSWERKEYLQTQKMMRPSTKNKMKRRKKKTINQVQVKKMARKKLKTKNSKKKKQMMMKNQKRKKTYQEVEA